MSIYYPGARQQHVYFYDNIVCTLYSENLVYTMYIWDTTVGGFYSRDNYSTRAWVLQQHVVAIKPVDLNKLLLQKKIPNSVWNRIVYITGFLSPDTTTRRDKMQGPNLLLAAPNFSFFTRFIFFLFLTNTRVVYILTIYGAQ